ncbi:hypothetical protein Bbelb_341780 [Branchiostoma belcheri]|nr:hypothetical protein Bbelb_341780 [Branchiostoma belcheri]
MKHRPTHSTGSQPCRPTANHIQPYSRQTPNPELWRWSGLSHKYSNKEICRGESRDDNFTFPFSSAAILRCKNEDEQPPPSDPPPICRTLGTRWTGPASPVAGNYYLLTPLITYSSVPWPTGCAFGGSNSFPRPVQQTVPRGDAPPVGHPPAKPPDDYRGSGAGYAVTDHYGGRGPGYSHNLRVVGRTPPSQLCYAFPLKATWWLGDQEHISLCSEFGKKRKLITTNQALPFVAMSVSTETDKHDSNITHLCTQAWKASSGVRVALGGDTVLQIVPMGLDSLSQTFAVVMSDIMPDRANRSISYADGHSRNVSTFGHEEMINVTCHVDARGETYRHVFTAPVSGTPGVTVCVEKTTRTVPGNPGDTTVKRTQLATTKPITLTTEVARNQTNLIENRTMRARPGKEHCACMYEYVGIITGIASVLAVVGVELVALLVVCVIRNQRRPSRQDNRPLPPVVPLNRWVLGGAGGEDAPVNGSPVSATDAATQTAECDLHQYDEIPDAYFNYYNTRPGVQNPYWEIPDEYYTDYVNTRTEAYPDEVVAFYAAAANVALPSQTRQGGKHLPYNTVPRTRSLPQIHARQRTWSIKNVHGNRRRHRSRFLVRVDTGHDWGAGTRSKVVFVLTGDKGSTGPRSFQQDDMTFQTGGVNTFLLTTPQKLGGLTSLTVWHDNSGEGRHASWFLERVEVTDLRTNKKTQFVCNDWLGVEHGDGCLKRTLPPTAETDVSLGQRFSLKLREKFKDGHVWLSVVTSRPKSYFSRVQRLSCCLCLLFCKMITSAMWFRGAGQGASSVVLTIGSVELTAETLLVSLWTTLQVFPVNLIIVQIFRRCRPKGVPKSSGLQLPYWSVYVGWTLLVLTTLASGFFLLLYSMEWGRDKSIQWLTAFGLSFLQSMVVVQPAEAVILAFGTSVLCACRAKKSDTDDKDEDVEAGKQTLPAEPLAAWSELQETEQLKQQRAERKNWLQLTNNGKQCILGIIIITAAILMVHEVKTQRDVLLWLEGAFARKLYPTHQYNGDALDWRDSVFINDMPAYRVGPVRLGQIRARTGKCDVPQPALHSNKTCVMTYVSGIAGEAAASFPESTPTTFSHVVHGTIGSYGGPGYRVNLGEMQAEMMETLRILEANRWIDQYTTALVLDLTLYHVNANLFSTVSVLFEFPSSAGAIATLKVSTFPLTAQGMAPTIIFVAKAVFVACLLYVTIRLVKNARKEGRSFILQVWTVVEVASVVASLYVIWAMASKDAFVRKAKTLISQELQKGA